MLRELADEGRIESRRKKLHHPGTLPSVTLADITGRDADGELIATPTEWDEEAHGPAPKIRIATPRKARPRRGRRRRRPRAAARRGDRRRDDAVRYTGRVIKIIDKAKARALGIFRALPGGGGRLVPIDKKQLGRELAIPREATKDAQDGDLIAVSVAQHGRLGLPTARVEERLGSLKSERAVSLIAIHAHDIPHVFPVAAVAEADAAKPADARRPRGLAQAAARHHRPGRRQGPRRRGACRARPRSAQSRRPHRHRRHRRRRALRAARLRARPRGAEARQFGLFPRPRGADAAGAHLQRSVLAAPARGPRGAGGAHDHRRRRPQALAHVPPRADALGREAQLRAGAGRDRRPHRRGHRAAARPGAAGRSTPPTRRSSARATRAGRSTSTCPSARSCSRPTARSIASSRRSGWSRTG